MGAPALYLGVANNMFSGYIEGSMHSNNTPSFRPRAGSEDASCKSALESIKMASFDSPERYLYEFYSCKEFLKFKKYFIRVVRKQSRMVKPKEIIALNGDPSK